jgi:MFS family permease
MTMTKRRRQPCQIAFLLLISPLAADPSSAFCLGAFSGNLSYRGCGYRRERIHGWRGGAKHEAAALVETSEEDDSIEERWRRRGMTAALASTYFAVMGAKCALPSVLSLLTSSNTGLTYSNLSSTVTTQYLMAQLLGLSTLAIAVGKLVLGPIIDSLGGIRSLQVSLLSLALLILIIAFTQQFSIFAVCWILVDFIFSSAWAGCINAIHQSFPEKEWARKIGIIAAGARIGNTAAFALFASVLYFLEGKVKQPWRVIFGVSALLQLLPISLLTYFGNTTLKKERQLHRGEEKPSSLSSLGTLRREASTPVFWLHLISRSALMVFASFLLFVPTLMSKVYGVSNGFAAQIGSIYALGCLLSITTGSQLFSRLSKKGQALSIVGLMGAATISSVAQLAHVAGVWKMSATTSAAFLFLWGWAFAIPFYIPPSLYALARGGVQSSATIVDMMDIGGFTLLAVFNRYVASIQHSNPAAWIPIFQITTACSIMSLISLPLAVRLEINSDTARVGGLSH